jgi:hypothetical protein
MNANTNVAFVKFNNAKTMIATAMSDAQCATFERGEELGYASIESEIAWADALRLIKTPADRAILRAGFVSAYVSVRRVPEKSAKNRFDYLARQYAKPETSKRAKHTAETRGRKAKVEAKVEKLSEKDVAARLVRVLAYVAAAQGKHAGDAEMLEVLGDIARLANGAK